MNKFFYIILFSFGFVNAQDLVSGTVYGDSSDNPLPGANVYWLLTDKGTVTDIDGKFSTLIFAGSQPTLFGSRFPTVRKPQTNLKNDDIERSAPRSRYVASNKPDN